MVYNPPEIGQDPWGADLNETLAHLEANKVSLDTEQTITGKKIFDTPSDSSTLETPWVTLDLSTANLSFNCTYDSVAGTIVGTSSSMEFYFDGSFADFTDDYVLEYELTWTPGPGGTTEPWIDLYSRVPTVGGGTSYNIIGAMTGYNNPVDGASRVTTAMVGSFTTGYDSWDDAVIAGESGVIFYMSQGTISQIRYHMRARPDYSRGTLNVDHAHLKTDGNESIYFGPAAGMYKASNDSACVGIGDQSLGSPFEQAYNTAVGAGSLGMAEGDSNTALGYRAGRAVFGSNNTCVGSSIMDAATAGISNATFIGAGSGRYDGETGNMCTAIGYFASAHHNSVAIGALTETVGPNEAAVGARSLRVGTPAVPKPILMYDVMSVERELKFDAAGRLQAGDNIVGNVTRVLHDGTNYPARPDAEYVEWVGPTSPTAAIAGDTWVSTA